MKSLFSLLFFLLISFCSQAQLKLDSTLTPEENFELNCNSMLQYGMFVPSNLDECMIILLHYGDKKLREFKELSEADAEKLGFDEYETRLRTNWDLSASSVLAQYFYQHRIYDPETMTSVILVTFHRYINTKQFDDLTVIAEMKKKHKKVEKAALKKITKLGKSRYHKHKRTKRKAKRQRKKALKQESENSLLNEMK